MFVRANFVDKYSQGMRDRSMWSGTELAREIKPTDWSMAGNLSNRSSGVQIPRDICNRPKRYLYSAKFSWIINHITTSWRPINGLFFYIGEDSWRGAKIHWSKMPLLFIFLLFFNTPCWHWWDSQVSRLFNYVSFLKLHFKLVVRLVRSEC